MPNIILVAIVDKVDYLLKILYNKQKFQDILFLSSFSKIPNDKIYLDDFKIIFLY